MNEHISDIVVTDVEGTCVVTLSGKILDPQNIENISDRLQQLTKTVPSPKMVLDFSEVSHLSSSALGMLTTTHQTAKDAGGKLALCCLQPTIAEIFRITRLDEVLTISTTRDDALAAIK